MRRRWFAADALEGSSQGQSCTRGSVGRERSKDDRTSRNGMDALDTRLKGGHGP